MLVSSLSCCTSAETHLPQRTALVCCLVAEAEGCCLQLIDENLIDSNFNDVLLQLPLAAALLGEHHGLLSYGLKLKIYK